MASDNQDPSMNNGQPGGTSPYGKMPGNEVGFEPEVEQGLSPVATAKSRNVALLVLLVFGGILLVYYLFFATESDKKKEGVTPQKEKALASQAVKPASGEEPLPSVPSLPEPPPLLAPTPPPAPPAPVASPAIPAAPKVAAPALPTPALPAPTPHPQAQPAAVQPQGPTMDQRMHSSIMLASGSSSAGGGSDTGKDASKDDKDLTQGQKNQLANSKPFTKLAPTQTNQIRATMIGDMASVVAQGKVIEAVLETAINTDLTGSVRAIVSRDVYAEAGKRILIPKGARLLGEYAAKISPGQTRVAISWNRVIHPTGIDLYLEGGGKDVLGTSVDNLGRAGVEGLVDDHYFELMYNAVLLSTAQVAWSKGAEGLTNAGSSITSSTVAPDGTKSVTSSGSGTQQAVQSANSTLGNAINQIAGQSTPTQPTITIDQGTSMKIFVNQDLVFPSQQVTSHSIKVLR